VDSLGGLPRYFGGKADIMSTDNRKSLGFVFLVAGLEIFPFVGAQYQLVNSNISSNAPTIYRFAQRPISFLLQSILTGELAAKKSIVPFGQ
jgi:hypothetical protein